MNKLTQALRKNVLIDKISKWSCRVFIGKTGVSLNELFTLLPRKIKSDSIGDKARSIAYNFILAIFPAIIFLFTLIPYIPLEHLKEDFMAFLKETMPQGIYEAASSTIQDILSKPRGGLLSFGFFFALYLTTDGVITLMSVFNKCYRTREKRSFLKKRMVAVALTMLLSLIMFLAVSMLMLGRVVLDILVSYDILSRDTTFYIIEILRYLAVILLFFLATSVIYYFGPSFYRRKRFFTVGSVVATMLSVTLSYLFSYYLNNFGAYNKLYGSVGAVIGLMVWLYLMSWILLLGFEVNASIHLLRRRSAIARA